MSRRSRYGYVANANLTSNERYVLSDVASRVIDVMQWDKIDQRYEDRGDFILRLSKSDFQTLKRAYKKL